MYRPREERATGIDPSYAQNQIHDHIELTNPTLTSDGATTSWIYEALKQLQGRKAIRYDRLEDVLALKRANRGALISTELVDDMRGFFIYAYLPLKLEIDSALTRGWMASNYQRSHGFDGDVLAEMRRRIHSNVAFDFEDAGEYTRVINELGGKNRWPLSTTGQEARIAKAAETVIAHILGDKGGVYPVWVPAKGQVRWFRREQLHPTYGVSLDKADSQTLNKIDSEVSALRGQLNETREEQRDRLRELHTGVRQPRTELDLDVQRTDHGFEFVNGEDAAAFQSSTGQMDRATGVVVERQSGEFSYNRAELVAIARDQSAEARFKWRNLVRLFGADKINEVLRGI